MHYYYIVIMVIVIIIGYYTLETLVWSEKQRGRQMALKGISLMQRILRTTCTTLQKLRTGSSFRCLRISFRALRGNMQRDIFSFKP